MTTETNPTIQLVNSAKQLNSILSRGLNKVKSMRNDDPEYEISLQNLTQPEKETGMMLKRISVSTQSYPDSA